MVSRNLSHRVLADGSLMFQLSCFNNLARVRAHSLFSPSFGRGKPQLGTFQKKQRLICNINVACITFACSSFLRRGEHSRHVSSRRMRHGLQDKAHWPRSAGYVSRCFCGTQEGTTHGCNTNPNSDQPSLQPKGFYQPLGETSLSSDLG